MAKEEFKELKRFEGDLERCMKCGFCMFFCPVYGETKEESRVARGRNVFMKELLSGKLEVTDELFERFNSCLLCQRCVVFCPARVPTDALVVAARADMVRKKGLPPEKRIAFRGLIQHRNLFGKTVKLASYLQYLLPKKGEGNLRHLPEFISALGRGRHIPQIARKFGREMIPEVNPPFGDVKKGTIGFFMGCAMDFIYPHVAKKIVELLASLGYEVLVPKKQGCCGAPVYMSGDFETGRKLAENNIEAFKGVDLVVTGCATCGSAMKDYKKFLADTEERSALYGEFSSKVRDLSEFLIRDLGITSFETSPEVMGKTVTWHDPCHLVRHQGIREEPRKVLGALNINYVEMPNADMCCGMGGSFSLYYYDISRRIAEKKADSIKAVDADIVVTACPGCMIQLSDIIAHRNMPQRVMHIVELIE